jgi:hypothetical protein
MQRQLGQAAAYLENTIITLLVKRFTLGVWLWPAPRLSALPAAGWLASWLPSGTCSVPSVIKSYRAMKQFIPCAKCGKLFSAETPEQTLCTTCRSSAAGAVTETVALERCRSYIRSLDAEGKLVTVLEVAEAVGVPDDVVMRFIKDGLISTLSFNDPRVRAFLLKREQERAREKAKELAQATEEKEPPREEPRGRGFHIYDEEEEEQ